MLNFVQPGEILTLTAPSGGVVSGTLYQIGDLVVVATVSAAQDERFAAFVGPGVVTCPKTASQPWTEGVKVYWDDSEGEVTTDDDTGTNPLIGVAVAAVGSGADETTGTVRLDGVAR